MSSQDAANVIESANNLIQTVDSQILLIRNEKNQAIDDLELWKQNIFFSDQAKSSVSQGSEIKLDMTHLSNLFFYPVILEGGFNNRICEYEISRLYSDDVTPDSSIQPASLFSKFSYAGFTWGGNPNTLHIQRIDQTYIQTLGAIGYVNYYKPVLFLRGGYTYNIVANYIGVQFNLIESKTRYYHNSESPEHDSWIGPVDESTVLISEGALTMDPIRNTEHNKNLSALGG